MDASVALAAAYLRFNGYFVLTELPVHVAEGPSAFRSGLLRDLERSRELVGERV